MRASAVIQQKNLFTKMSVSIVDRSFVLREKLAISAKSTVASISQHFTGKYAASNHLNFHQHSKELI